MSGSRAVPLSLIVNTYQKPRHLELVLESIAAQVGVAGAFEVIVTDDDINIYDPNEVEWAVTFRCQADKDIVILSGMKAKHVDPSVRPWEMKPGELPLTSKFGIDATIPEGIPAFRYERIASAYLDQVRLEDYL